MFDNIEISKKITQVDFFDLYLEAADKIIEESYVAEGVNNCIKNVTVGFTNFDKEIIGIKDYPCLISKACNLKEKDFDSRLGRNRKYVDNLPQPLEVVTYSDSKNAQYLIRGTDRFKLGQSTYLYQDERNSVLHYNCDTEYDESYLDKICKIIVTAQEGTTNFVQSMLKYTCRSRWLVCLRFFLARQTPQKGDITWNQSSHPFLRESVGMSDTVCVTASVCVSRTSVPRKSSTSSTPPAASSVF